MTVLIKAFACLLNSALIWINEWHADFEVSRVIKELGMIKLYRNKYWKYLLIIHYHIFLSIFLLGIYFIYISNAIPKVPHMLPHPLPHPHTPTSWPCHSPVLRQIKFAWPMGLSFHWWPTRPSSDSYAARDMSSGGGVRGWYWSVHIVVPPIGLQISWAPWVLSLAPPLA